MKHQRPAVPAPRASTRGPSSLTLRIFLSLWLPLARSSFPPSFAVPPRAASFLSSPTAAGAGAQLRSSRPSDGRSTAASVFRPRVRLGMSSASPAPEWCPETGIYKGGAVPDRHGATVDELIEENDGQLKIFGYGSLCWSPGKEGVLSLVNDGGSGDVTTTPGRVRGYRRCWAQRSTDHRGVPKFNGIVCTLLEDMEVARLRKRRGVTSTGRADVGGKAVDGDGDGADSGEAASEGDEEEAVRTLLASSPPSMTEGLIYTVSSHLVEQCLAELDFREKGGYARDVIDVVEDKTGNVVRALLYRGTPDNPAFWKRAFDDLRFAAATIAVSVGPSGANDVYLQRLDDFLTGEGRPSAAGGAVEDDLAGDTDTGNLARMVRLLQTSHRPYFLFGGGSNERGQLLLSSDTAESRELTEMLLVVPRNEGQGMVASSGGGDGDLTRPVSLHAGGGHAALLTEGGDLYLWGWNDSGQCAAAEVPADSKGGADFEGDDPPSSPFLVISPLSNIKASSADLGHAHTLVVERDTGRLFGFGDNGRGQVDGQASETQRVVRAPVTPSLLENDAFVDVAAGLFHSAGVTADGELVTWGCGRFGQCLRVNAEISESSTTVGRWSPKDGSKFVQVACGRRHTIMLDDRGRVWTMGDNKYGQLGRGDGGGASSSSKQTTPRNPEPALIDGPLGRENSGCFDVRSGWSHVLALVRSEADDGSSSTTVYGWGRNDRGQLGTGDGEHVREPRPLLHMRRSTGDGAAIPIRCRSAFCGAESSHFVDVDGGLWSCGWNEHGNLANGDVGEKCVTWTKVRGARVVAPPSRGGGKTLCAAGGAHILVMAA